MLVCVSGGGVDKDTLACMDLDMCMCTFDDHLNVQRTMEALAFQHPFPPTFSLALALLISVSRSLALYRCLFLFGSSLNLSLSLSLSLVVFLLHFISFQDSPLHSIACPPLCTCVCRLVCVSVFLCVCVCVCVGGGRVYMSECT